MQEPLDEYVSKLLSEKGVPETPESHASLLEQVNEAIDQSLFESLTMDQIEELERATDENRADESMVRRMLEEADVDPTEVTSNVLAAFRNLYLEGEPEL